jgi:nucleoside-diphosphate-sugar epimerase
MPLRTLVLGASGLLGEPIVRNFHASGARVKALARGERAPPAGADFIAVDRHDPRALAAALQHQSFDLTVDLLAYDAPHLQALAAIPGFSPGRLIAISTGQVYLVGQGATPPFREPDARSPLLDEPPPGTRAHANWAYGAGKRRMEDALHALFPGALALRIPIVLGARDLTGRLWAYVERIRDGGPLLLPGDPQQPLRFVWAEDVARLLVALAPLPQLPPALNWAQPDTLTLASFVTTLAAALGLPAPPLVPCTHEHLASAALDDRVSPFCSRWCSILDPSLAEGLVGFQATPFPRALPLLLAAMEHLYPAPDEAYEHRAAELNLAATLALA